MKTRPSTTASGAVSNGGPPAQTPLDLPTIYRQHAQFVWMSLQRLGIRPADLDDVAHDVFVVVHTRLSSYDGSSRMTTWLFGICMRVAANYRRRRRWKLEILSGGNDDERPAPLVSADELLIRDEDRERAERALDKLDVARRAVFVMFEIESLSCAEIAELMGIPVGTVYSRLHSARKQLEGLLARDRRERTPDTESADHSGGGRR